MTKSQEQAKVHKLYDLIGERSNRNGPDWTVSVTYGDQAEIHAGMSKEGALRERGLTVKELQDIAAIYHSKGAKVEYYDLNTIGLQNPQICEPAAILIVRGGVDVMLKPFGVNAWHMYHEQRSLPPCTKFYNARAKKVQNKNARWNNVFGFADDPGDLTQGRGPVTHFDRVPITGALQAMWPDFVGDSAKELVRALFAESNIYYEQNSYIGYHGDKERRIVICARLGRSMKLAYTFFQNCNAISQPIILELHHGDIYFMSSKAVGFDWRQTKDSLVTLRHAAAFETKKLYPVIKQKK